MNGLDDSSPLHNCRFSCDNMPCIPDLAFTNLSSCFKNIARESHMSPLMKSASQNFSIYSREQNLTRFKSWLWLLMQEKKTERISASSRSVKARSVKMMRF